MNRAIQNIFSHRKKEILPMSASLYTCFVFLLAFGFQHSSSQSDSLKNLGHASMKIKTADGRVIYIDPSQGTDYADSADFLLVTHSHSDHNNQSLVKKKPGCTVITHLTAIQGGVYQSFSVNGITIDAVAAYNGNHPKASCVGYVLEFNGIRLYHAGDTGNITEMASLAARNLDYALLPMEGVFTMSPQEATLAAGAIKAKQNVPIHTMTLPDTYSDAIVAQFNVPNKIILKNNQSIALAKNPTKIDGGAFLPVRFFLEQNFPNPFNPSTTIRFTVPRDGFVSLRVFDLLGKEVARLVHEYRASGNHLIDWNAGALSNGIYFYRLASGNYSDTKKLVILK